MNKLTILAVAVWAAILAISVTSCSAGPAPREAPAEEAEGCTLEGHFFAVGTTYNTGPAPCNTYTCHAADTIYALTCAWFTAGEGCEIVPGNQSAVYPNCCPVERCDDNLINVDQK